MVALLSVNLGLSLKDRHGAVWGLTST